MLPSSCLTRSRIPQAERLRVRYGVELRADAVIDDADRAAAIGARHVDRHRACPRMPRDVGERLLNDTKNRRRREFVEIVGALRDPRGRAHAVAARKVVGQPVECRGQAEVVKQRWTKVRRNAAQRGRHRIDLRLQFAGFVDLRSRCVVRLKPGFQQCVAHFRCGQPLPEVVVQFARDALLLVLVRSLHLCGHIARAFERGEPHALGHVARYFCKAEQRARFIAHRGEHDIRPEARTVAAHPPSFASSARPDALASSRWFVRRDVFRRIERREVAPDDFVRRIAFDALRAGVPACHAARRIQPEARVVSHRVDQQMMPVRNCDFG
jgi:hypothetical protein